MRAIIISIALGLTGCATLQPKARPAEPGEVVLIGTPRLALMDIGKGGCQFHLYVRIPNPAEEMYCPEVTIETHYAPPGRDVGFAATPYNTAVYEADCAPWTLGGWHRDAKTGEIVDDPPSAFDEHRRHYLLGEGEWLFRVRANQAGHEHTAEIRMSCKGGSGAEETGW